MSSTQLPMGIGPEAVRDVSDQQLLERFIAQGDETAFVGLVQRYSRSVWGVCRRLLNQEQDAEDAFQAVFLVLARKAKSIRKGEALGSWLYGVAYRTAAKARQIASRRAEWEKKATAARPEPPPPTEAAWRELQRHLDEELQRLAERHRAPFVLCCLEGMSRAEAARELGWKEGTVSSRLAHARKLLQTRLARRGVTITAVLTAAALAQNTATAAPAVLGPQTGAALSPAATALADSVIGSLAAAKIKVGFVLAVLLTMLAGATGLTAFHLGTKDDPEALQKFTDVDLAGGVAGVSDSGFYAREKHAGKPCRWTTGSARLTVPLKGEKPRTLALTALIPNRPGYHLRVVVNGKTLFDDQPWAGRICSYELPLSGVDLGDSARIELISSTCVPAQEVPNNTDDRTLGIRVTRLILQTDAAAAKPVGRKEYAREYTHSLAGKLEDNPTWKLYGPYAKQCVRLEPAGLRLQLPLGYAEERRETGLSTGIEVKGDFEITTQFEILREPRQADTGAQTRLLLTLLLDRAPKDKPYNNRAAITRQAAPTQGIRFQTWLLLWNEKVNNLDVWERGFPTTAKTGRLRMVRSGSLVSYHVAEGLNGEFRLLNENPMGRADVKDVRFGGMTGGSRAALDVVFSNLRIRADNWPNLQGVPAVAGLLTPPAPLSHQGERREPAVPSAEPPSPSPDSVSSTEPPPTPSGSRWLPVGLLLGLALTVAAAGFTAAVFYLRWRRGAGQTPAPSPSENPPAAGVVAVSCSGCGRNLKVKAELAGKKVKCPRCGKVVLVPEPESASHPKASPAVAKVRLLAALGAAFAALVLFVFAVWLVRPARLETSSFLDVALGNRFVPGVEDSGFYHDENSEHGPSRWTNGHAMLVIPLAGKERPQSLLVQLGLPKKRSLRITVNNRELVNEKASEQTPWIWERTLELDGVDLGEKLVVEIVSDTSFAPNDSRALGVVVRGIRLLSGRQKYTDEDLAGGQTAGVLESGFHARESLAGKPCRWTTGSARLTIPLHGEKPRTLALSAWIPDRPKYRVRVTVNGKPLFDDEVKSRQIWSCELPLSGVDLGDSACIELDSSTFVPGQTARNKDNRTLGIRVTRLILQTDSPPGKK